MVYHLGIALISIIISASLPANAQGLPGSSAAEGTPAATPSGAGAAASDSEVEALYDKEDSKPAARAEKKAEERTPAPKIPEAQNLSDLAKLAPFSDVAVIQRRFLPKSKRFEATVGGFTNLNNPFFSSYGFEAKGAYYLTEKWAAEVIGNYSTTASRQVTDDLAKNRGITTSNLVTSRSFIGGAIKWNPIYGKITLLNKSIVPFDLNFDIGGGMTQTTDGQSVPTAHLGTSQVFAYSKSTAFRWDFSWNGFQADSTDDNGKKSKITQSDIYLGVGVSFYFPEASYR
ncbi:MAG: outer membrane beta-barrel domain-containing protein [Bdellovibrionales bacterium]